MYIFIPPELKFIEDDLARFFDAMVYKLRKNVHKGRWEDMTMATAMDLMKKETEELHKALQEGNRIEMVLESADVANFAMILCAIALVGSNDERKTNVQERISNAEFRSTMGNRSAFAPPKHS